MAQVTAKSDPSLVTLIAIGANATSQKGDPRESILTALRILPDEGFRITAKSHLFQTLAVPAGSGPNFVNAAVAAHSVLSPGEQLAALHRIEACFGRQREVRWGPRTMDLDLLAVGDEMQPDRGTLAGWIELAPERQAREAPSELILPHPRMQDRGFVLVPLAQIAPDWRHPMLERSVAEMLAALPASATAGITPIR